MKLTINTEVLQREHLSLPEFLTLLMGFYDIDYKKIYDDLITKNIIEPNLYNSSVVLSNNTKDLVARLLLESDDKVFNSGIDFNALAEKLQAIYPEGNKPGSTYKWRSTTDTIAQKLRTLIATHNFLFTEEEAINATKAYVSSFTDTKPMQLLRYFLLRTIRDSQGNIEIESQFMTIIENNREQ